MRLHVFHLNVKLIWCIVRVARVLSLSGISFEVHHGCFGRSHPIVASHLPLLLLLRAAPMPSQPAAARRVQERRLPPPIVAPASPCTVTPGTALRYFLQSNSSRRTSYIGASGLVPNEAALLRDWNWTDDPAPTPSALTRVLLRYFFLPAEPAGAQQAAAAADSMMRRAWHGFPPSWCGRCMSAFLDGVRVAARGRPDIVVAFKYFLARMREAVCTQITNSTPAALCIQHDVLRNTYSESRWRMFMSKVNLMFEYYIPRRTYNTLHWSLARTMWA